MSDTPFMLTAAELDEIERTCRACQEGSQPWHTCGLFGCEQVRRLVALARRVDVLQRLYDAHAAWWVAPVSNDPNRDPDEPDAYERAQQHVDDVFVEVRAALTPTTEATDATD